MKIVYRKLLFCKTKIPHLLHKILKVIPSIGLKNVAINCFINIYINTNLGELGF